MLIDDNAGASVRKSHLFMLRFWMEELGDGQTDWRGKVQHVHSGEVRYIRSWLALEEFVKGFLSGLYLEEARDNGIKETKKDT
jgi:hypothetical protein